MKFLYPLLIVFIVLPAVAETAPQDESATNTTAAGPTAETAGHVARSGFATTIDNREPADNISALANDNHKIYYFTEIKGMSGHTVKHRWEWNGQVMAEVPFTINGDRWRVFSSKNLDPSWIGEWKASVVDENGNTLSVNTFSYETSAMATSATTTESGTIPPTPQN
jgi:hypothetical protein